MKKGASAESLLFGNFSLMNLMIQVQLIFTASRYDQLLVTDNQVSHSHLVYKLAIGFC